MKLCVRWKQKLRAKTLSISHLNEVNKHHKKVLYTTTFLTQFHKDNTGRPVPECGSGVKRYEPFFSALWLRATLTSWTPGTGWDNTGALLIAAVRKDRRYVERKEKFPALVASPRGCQFSFTRIFLVRITKLFGHAWPLIVSFDRSGSGMEKVLLLICVKT